MKNRIPDSAMLYLDGKIVTFAPVKAENTMIASEDCPACSLRFDLKGDDLTVFVKAPERGVRYVRLRWNLDVRPGVKVLGDAWERSYGELGWESVRSTRCMPWYMAISNGSDLCRDFSGRLTECFGLGVRCASLCFWQCDEQGVTLWMDIRNGGVGTLLGERELNCGTVLMREYASVSAYEALQSFCRVMSPETYKTDHVVYGSNNWYYAYGHSSHEEILSDSRFVADLCRGNENPPYMVIDDGWELNTCDAPWIGNEKFPDMKGLADEMRKIGVRPGIWIRPLADEHHTQDLPAEAYFSHRPGSLDPSHPSVKAYVAKLMKTLVEWGFTLIKHDYSTFDLFGSWGRVYADGWNFYDRTHTTAEILVDFYKTIRDAVPDAVIIGCDCIGHLCAGLHQINRIGDDTSGYDWQRTVNNGVNTVAYRLCQHNSFFGADGDCVGIMGRIDWQLNRRWLKLLSRSGTPLFVSCKPGILDEDGMNDLREAFRYASTASDVMIPLDWMESATPRRYLINGEEVVFDWYPETGADTYRPSV